MKNFSIKRFTASLLFIVMVVAALPVSLFNFTISTSAAESDTIYVLAGGDFQAGDNGQADHYYSRINMGNILDKIKEKYSTMNGFIFVGDYDGDTHNDSNANAGVAAMMEEVSERFGTLNHNNSYLIEGNHETGAVSGIDATGGYDCDGYAVYLINETDFCERQDGKSAQIQTVANNLKTWLNNKIGEGYDAPIFVATHTPLGYTTRTYTNGDSLYGKYVFDVLNDAAANGLNIIFMHGHDHAYGADNYLGGEAIYLPVGDKINICVPGDKTDWTEETLNFTYMNAGYVGYYNENYYNVNSYEAEKLTMTVFAITGNQVTVERWSKDGLYNLKSAGREGFYSNASNCAAIGLSYNTTVYASPQTIALVENDADEMGTIGEWVGVAAETPADDVTTSNKGWVEIVAPVPGSFTEDVSTSGNSWVTLTQPTGGTTTYIYTKVDTIEAGKEYVIVDGDNAVALNYTASSYGYTASMTGQSVTIEGSTIKSTAELPLWTFSGTGTANVNNGDYYLRGGSSISLLQYESEIFVVDNGDDFTLKRRERNTGYALYYNGTEWTTSSSNTQENVRLYELTDTSISGGSNGLYAYLKGDLRYTITEGMTAEQAKQMVKDGIAIQYATAANYSDEKNYPDDGDGVTWTLDPNYDPNVPGDYAVTIAFNGTTIGVAEVIVPAKDDVPGTYATVTGNLTYTATAGMSAQQALDNLKAQLTGYVYEGMSAPGTATAGEEIPYDQLKVEWAETYSPNTAGDYKVTVSYNGKELATAEVVVPATTTYYIAEGNGLYLVDMNTTETNAMAEVMAGVTVYSATDASGSNKTEISDADVTWNWVDTYNGADSGPYTVEILKDGNSLGTVEVKVNIRYETGIEGDWTYIGESEATGGSYTYTLDTDGIDAGSGNKYIIVAENQALALHTSGSSASTAVSVNISSDGKTLTTSTRDYEYYWNTTYGFTRDGYNGLYQSSWAIYLGTKSASYLDGVVNYNNGTYTLYDNEGNIRSLTYSSGWTVNGDENTYTNYKVRLYKYTGMTGGTPAGSIYALIEGDTVYTVDQGTSATKALAAVKAGITGYTATDANGTGKTEIADSDLTWKWKNTFNGNSTGSYWVEISYQGKVLGTVEVQVIPAVVDDYPDYPNEGAVKVNKTAIYTDEQFRKTGVAQVELSVSGVPSKKGVDVILMLDTSSSMTSHTVTGSSKTRAQVLEESLANLIKQFKTPGDDGQLLDIQIAIADFNGFYGDNHNTSGTPYDRDADDMMSDDISYNANSEAQIYTGDHTLGSGAFISVDDLAASYTLNYTSGTNYDYAMDAIYQLATAKKLANGNEDRDLYVIFMSDGAAMQWNYYHSQGASSLWNNWITGAWDADDLTTANLNCETHKYYYNLTDTNGDGMLNEHWMANAIKGDPTQTYKVIRKASDLGTAVEGEANMYMVAGLGATMFSISFDAQADTNVTEESMDKSIATLASEQTGTTQYYYKVTSAEELDEAFDVIGTEIAYAASNARFVDQMGDAFDLQMASSVTRKVDGTDVSLGFTPAIIVKQYAIYTKAEADAITEGTAGDDVTNSMIGVRKSQDPTILEIVCFSADGTKAYSNLIDVDKDGSYGITVGEDDETGYATYTPVDADDNILSTDGLIYAKTFLFNTNTENAVTASGTSISVDPETFYWKVGTVKTDELAISYYVYLTDTLEGERAPGSYATNNFAILYYDNYLGNECEIHTVSPMLAWKQANVSYAFYLVNKNGEVIVNRATGETGTFANKVAVTRPIVYDYCYLNTSSTLEARTLSVAESTVLPEGYTVYDNAAAYKILVLSDTAGEAGWEITKSGDVSTYTTYVTGFSSDVQYSNDYSVHEVTYDYTHTTVWFAVVWTPSTIPDQVVIDYGLPVDISVLENDLFGSAGKLNSVGAYTDEIEKTIGGTALANGFSTSYTGTYGIATADIDNGKVRYQLNISSGMQMSTYEKFAYAVNYTGSENPGYYYGIVTVIPATTIYYEESFVTFENGYEVSVSGSGTATPSANPVADGSEFGAWSKVGTEIKDATQAEDRPGKESLGTIDSDNIYGYDGVNSSITEYSLGTAMQATVNKAVNDDGSYTTTGYNGYAPTATFTFTGTGFDIISLTDSDSGMIMVTVADANGKNVYSQMITNYYGMSYKVVSKDENGNDVYGWVSEEKAEGQDTIWQVPVIKKSGLTHDTYTVTIQVGYMSFFDQDNGGTGDGKYYFVLDSIRVYDPANGGANDNDSVIENAYKADGESNPHYLLIKDAILAAADAETLYSNGTEGNGVVFIDGIPDATKVSDYKNPGPNNEAYLAPGQSISFKLKATATPLEVHIGAKLASGSSADVQFTYTVGSKSESKIRTFTTATDMYYPITDYLGLVQDNQESTSAIEWPSGTITLTNVSTDAAIVSLTNIKATFKLATATNSGTTIQQSASASTGVYSLMSARMVNLETVAEEEPVSISFLVDAEVIEAACAVMTALYAPEPEIFVPEALEYTVANRFFGNSTVNVITSKDVASLTVNGVEAKKLSNSPLFSMLLKLIDGFESRFGTNISTNDYIVWSASVKRAANYDIVAYNADGLSSDPTVTDSSSSITKEDIDNYFNRSELYSIMEQMASQRFDPEQFEAYVNERFDGFREIITQTSEDVEYVIINGKIVDRYITETVIDTETGETTTKRVWITDAEDDVDDEDVEVNAYDEKGVGSESKKAERKFGWKKNSNNGNSNSASDKNNNKENNGKGNSGKYGRM